MLRRPTRIIVLIITFVFMTACPFPQNEAQAATKAAPKLISLKYYQTAKGKYYASLSWKSKKGYTYQILRKKSGGKYKAIATKKAKKKTTSYIIRNVGLNKTYTYSVRQIRNKRRKAISSYDKVGLKLMKRPAVSVDFQNMKSVIYWNSVSGATNYAVYRKIGKGKYHRIAFVNAGTNMWVDTYWEHKTALKSILLSDTFVDPSNNPIKYTVRPYYKARYRGTAKASWGLYLRDGVCHLEPPTIVSLSDEGILRWGTVPNATKYHILIKPYGATDFSVLKTVNAGGGKYQSSAVSGNINLDSYAVQAYTKENGMHRYSDYDTGFTRINKKYHNKRVLFLGDSITFGSPYYGEQKKNFAYPNRVQQLTGINFFNPSIPGSTWHFDENTGRHRIVTGVAGMIHEGLNTDLAYTGDNLGIGANASKMEDYDIVVLAAGTNDYNDAYYKRPEGEPFFGNSETDWTKVTKKTTGLKFSIIQYPGVNNEFTGMDYDYNIRTFNGAYNQIMKYIEEGSSIRVASGRAPIKVVTMDLFYSDRVGSDYQHRNNRDTTKNKYGYTLQDYQAELDKLNHAWSKSPVLDIYHYDTRAEGIVNSANCPYRASDNLHFTKHAYGLYGNSLANFLVNKVIGEDVH